MQDFGCSPLSDLQQWSRPEEYWPAATVQTDRAK